MDKPHQRVKQEGKIKKKKKVKQEADQASDTCIPFCPTWSVFSDFK